MYVVVFLQLSISVMSLISLHIHGMINHACQNRYYCPDYMIKKGNIVLVRSEILEVLNKI